ncbi:MAG: histidine kinase, partial [Ornithinimicrobium sp.]
MTDASPAMRDDPRWQIALDLTGAIVFAAFLGAFAVLTGLPSWLPVIGILAMALAVRHRSVTVMIALAVLAALIQVTRNDVALPADLAYAVLFFSLGMHPDRRLRFFGLGAAIFAAVIAGTFFGQQALPSGQVLEAFGFAVVGTAAVTVGGWVAGYVRWLNRRALQANLDAQFAAVEQRRLRDAADQERERAQIATDMHDVVAHSWAVVAAQADGARYSMRQKPEAAEQALVVISETARSSIADLRVILARLRYQESEGTTPGFAQQNQLFSRMRASGMQLVDSQEGTPSDSPLIALTAYRLLSEALTNALKHGDLREPVQVSQDWSDGYRLRVVNVVSPDGPGDGAGQGIRGMRERAAAAGGQISSAKDQDRWVLEARVPPTTEQQET